METQTKNYVIHFYSNLAIKLQLFTFLRSFARAPIISVVFSSYISSNCFSCFSRKSIDLVRPVSKASRAVCTIWKENTSHYKTIHAKQTLNHSSKFTGLIQGKANTPRTRTLNSKSTWDIWRKITWMNYWPTGKTTCLRQAGCINSW